jgi:acyl-coenzyme A synthetase/AMP-(fatty) acid ligase
MAHSGSTVAFVEHSLLDRHVPGRPALVVDVPGVGSHDVGPAADGVTGWSEILDDDDAAFFQVPRDQGELAEIPYTSGSTGHPKAVALRHDNSSLVPFREPTWNGGLACSQDPPPSSPTTTE